MASNGLVANASKTEFMILNDKEKNKEATIKVGNSTVTQTQTAKLLGITMDANQKWDSHFINIRVHS